MSCGSSHFCLPICFVERGKGCNSVWTNQCPCLKLADLAKSGAEMNRIRDEEKAAFDKNHPEMEQGLEGVKLALKILNEYYRGRQSPQLS